MPGGLAGAQKADGRRQHEDQHYEDEQRQRDGALDKGHKVAIGDAQSPAQVLLGQDAEDERQHRRRHRDVVTLHQVADQPETEQHQHVEDAEVQRVGAEHRERYHPRVEHRRGRLEQLGEQADERKIENEQHDVADIHAGDDCPDQLRVGVEELRPRLQPVHHEDEQEQGRRGRARNAEREQRHHGTAHARVVGRLRPCNALYGPPPELLGVLREPLFEAVGEEGGERRTYARQHAYEEAEDASPPVGTGGAAPVLAGHPDGALDALRVQVARATGCHVGERLRQREEGYRHEGEVYAVGEVRDAEGEPLDARLGVYPHHRDRESKERGDERLQLRACSQVGNHHQREEHQEEILRRAEGYGNARERGGQEHQPQSRESASDERTDRGRRERRPGAPLLGHLVAVERGHYGGDLSGGADKDGGRRATVHRAVIDTGKQDEPAHGVEPEGEWDQERDSRDGPYAGQHAYQRPDQDSAEGEDEVGDREGFPEPLGQPGEYVGHRLPLTQNPRWQLHAEHVDEDRVHDHREGDGVHQVAYPVLAIQVRSDREHEQKSRDSVAERHEDQNVPEQQQRNHPELAEVLGRRVVA